MWPTDAAPHFGAFVRSQVDSLLAHGAVDCEVVFARRDYLALRRRVVERVRAWRPDLVHAHFGYTAAAIALDCRRLGVPLLISYCGGDLHGEVGNLRRRTKTLLGVAASVAAGFLAERLVVKSESMLACLPRALRRRTSVIPNGVDLARFRPIDRESARAALGWALRTPIVLFGGRANDPTKNFPLAQSALEIVGKRFPGARMEQLIGVPPADVPLWINAADAVLLTSLKEGSPNIVKEACACDVPVVSTDVGDVRTVLEGSRSSRVVVHDAAALAAALEEVLAVTGARSGDRALVVAKGLDAQSIARRLTVLYSGIAGASAAPRPEPRIGA